MLEPRDTHLSSSEQESGAGALEITAHQRKREADIENASFREDRLRVRREKGGTGSLGSKGQNGIEPVLNSDEKIVLKSQFPAHLFAAKLTFHR